MQNDRAYVGRVLRSSTVSFSVGCRQPYPGEDRPVPQFGTLVKTIGGPGHTVYGLVCDVVVNDDAFVRQIVASGVENREIIEDQRQKRQVPAEAEVLVVGYGLETPGTAPPTTEVCHRLPPRPPGTLDTIHTCDGPELVRFTTSHDWLRIALSAPAVPIDQLIVAALRAAAGARPPGERDSYLVSAGRELARLLALDPVRLDGILCQLRSGSSP